METVEIKAVLNILAEKVDRLINAVLGNGHTGLVIRVDRIEQKEEKREDLILRLDRLEQRAAFQNKLSWAVISGGILAVITAVVTIII